LQVAVTKFLNEAAKRSLARDADCLKQLDPFIGDLEIKKELWAHSSLIPITQPYE